MPSIDPRSARAAKKYGPLVNRLARARYGISGAQLLAKLDVGESGDRMSAVSSAGARGKTQFIAGTRASVLLKYGIDPWRSTDEAFHAAALHLLGKVNGSKGLEGYNPGSSSYPSYILAQQVAGLKGVHVPAAKPDRSMTTRLRAGTLGTVKVDTDGAIVDSLLEHHKTGLLQSAVSKVESGAYTTTTAGRDPKLVKKYGVAGPAAGDPHSHVDTGQKGTANFEGHTVAAWIAPALRYARAHGWEGTVSSGFRSFADQKRIYDSGVRPAAEPGTSNHEGAQFPRGAVDVTDAPALSAILLKSPYAKKLIYAGGKDPVHFSHPHDGSY